MFQWLYTIIQRKTSFFEKPTNENFAALFAYKLTTNLVSCFNIYTNDCGQIGAAEDFENQL